MPVVTSPHGKDIDVRPRRGGARRAGSTRPGAPRPAAARKKPASGLRRWLAWRGALVLGLATAVLGAGGIAGYALWKSGAIDEARARVEAWHDRVAAFAPFPLEDVSVDGRKHVSQEAILKALDVRRGQSLLTVDLPGARERLERIEWVEHAAVERRWPDSIHVALRERSAVALWQTVVSRADGSRALEYVLIDRFGRRVRAVDPAESQVRLLLAGDGAPEHLGELLLLLQDAKPVRDRLRSAVYVGGRRWNLILDGGITLKLPADDAGAALARVVALHASDQLLARELSVVDVRLPDLLVLRPAGAPDPIQSVGARAPVRPEPQPAGGARPPAGAPARPPAAGPNDNLRGKTGAPPAGQRI